jgi:hypothetical protein
MGLPVHYVDLRAFCYATEDETRVRAALDTVLPPEAEIDAAVGEGHHGDRIVILTSRVETAGDVRTIFDRLRDALDVDRIRSELETRLDDNNALYLGLDKQAAARGEIELGDGLTFRAKLEAYPATRENALESAREILQ